MEIQYYKNHEIDRNAWDNCIARSFHGSIAAFSWFLDILCDRWDALIEGKYESVMPLPVASLFGKPMVYLPYWAFDFGIFSHTPVTPAKTRVYLDAVKRHFSYSRIALNKYNPLEGKDPHTFERKRFEIDLIKPYPKLSAGFTPELQRKLNIAMAHGHFFSTGLSPYDLIRFINEYRIPVPRALYQHHYRLLRSVMAGLIQYRAGELFGLYDRHNELSSAGMLAWINHRIHLILQVTIPDKEQVFSNLFLIDRIIEKYAETQTILLLEPAFSSRSSFSFHEFGARETHFLEITHNRLPIPLKWFMNQRILTTCLSSVHASKS